ncbi:hypothetical protein C8R44DRAFT_224034 [Mycena epipterygia]|nr:hypothetical protein C8R44DRAFT_224034 [Mycena epipterygia]
MVVDTDPRANIFQGVKYHICPCLPAREELRHILEINGAQEAENLKVATRVIIDQLHFSQFQELQCTATLVTPQWVYGSVKAGVKQPAQYFSADPALFFSSLVVSVVGVSATHADLVRTITTKYGGQWEETLTENVTHLIADNALGARRSTNLHPIVLSHAWFADSIRLESLQDTTSYELAERSVSERSDDSAYTIHHFPDPAPKTVRTACSRPLPFIPFEIIAKIFLMNRDLDLDQLRGCIHVLLNLSQVCQRWREIAHDTTPLWNHIFLDFHTKKSYNRRVKLAEAWIARSGSHPLSVDIRSYYPLNAGPNPSIDFLVAHASRIRNLSMKLPAARFCTFFQIAERSLPALETVTLSIIPKSSMVFDASLGMTRAEFFAEDFFDGLEPDSGMLWGDLNCPVSVFQHATNLRSLSIDAIGVNINPHILGLPWSSLTDIDLPYVSMGLRDTWDLLPFLVNVINFNFSNNSSQGPVMALLAPLKLPIRTLKWAGLGVNDTSIFSPLILPELTHLEMREGTDCTLLCLRQYSSFALQKLDLTFFQLSFPAISKFLRDTPSITTLRLYFSVALTDALMEFLTYDAQKPILPRLVDLDLFDREKYFTESAMMRMVESRWRTKPIPAHSVPLLQRVHICTEAKRGCFFASRSVVPKGLTVIPVSAPLLRRRVLERISEMNEEGLVFEHEIKV